MGLLDALFDPSTFSGSGGGLLDLIRQQNQYQPGFGDAPASPQERMAAMPGMPPAYQPAPQSISPQNYDPQTFAPNQAAPISVGSYQMPRIGAAPMFASAPDTTLPANALPTQGQLPPPSAPMVQPPQSQLPPAFGSEGGGFLDRLKNIGNPDGLIAKLTGSDTRSIAQQNLRAQFEATRQVLERGGVPPQEAAQKAMLAALNPKAAETILNEALTNKEKYTQTGEDSFGNKQYGFVNERDQTINGKPIGAGEPSSAGSFLAPGTKQIDSSLTGGDYLKQFSPEVQAAVNNYIDGKSTPTGNPRKGFTQAVKMIAQKVGADNGQSVDDASFAARKTMRNQLSSSAPSSLGGQINIGNTAAGHLADLSQKALDLGNYDTGIAPLSGAVNSIRGLGTEQAAKMEALKGAAQHYGQEITKFYAGSPGGVAERDRFIESVNGARSPKELAAILATEGELMHSRLDALGGQIKGVLGDDGLKQYPVLRPDGQKALVTVEQNVSKLKGGQTAAAGGVVEGATATNPQTGQKLTFRGGKWQ